MGYTSDPYQFFYPDQAGDDYPAAEHTAMVEALGEFLTQAAELLGLSGCFAATDFNGSAIPSQLALAISSGRAFIGSGGDRKLVYRSATSTVQNGVGGVTITPNATNYFYLLQNGTWSVNTTGTAPTDSILVCSAVFDVDDATSVNNAPAARVNLGAVMSVLQHLASATPAALSIGGAGAAGSATTAARSDHSHPMPAAAAAVATGNANAAGAATSFARSDHVHALGTSSVDGTTLEINSGAARIKDLGVSDAKLATNAVTTGKILDGSVTTGKILDAAVTAAKLADAVQDAVGGAPALSAAAEVADARQVTIQCKDLADNNLAERRLVRIWIGDSDFGGECATAPDGGVTVDTGALLQTVTAGKQLVVLSNPSGVVQVTLTESTVKTFYVMAGAADRPASVAVAFA